jgi:5-methylcytosine-specific restriction endonuclease McrA
MAQNEGPARIKRHDYGNTHGYWVRYNREGALFTKLFSDSIYGSAEAALEAAQKWHDELLAAFPLPNRREFAQRARRKSGSGIVGVRRGKDYTNGKTYDVWIASWSPQRGVYKTKKFSILKHGEEGAKQLAIAAREAGLKEMELDWGGDFTAIGNPGNSNSEASVIPEEPENIFAFEADQAYQTHLTRERDKSLRQAAIDLFIEKHGHVFCELCGFDFANAYGSLGTGIIEVHHTKPLALIAPGEPTMIADLMLLCSNCHLVIHAGDPLQRLETLRSILPFRKK